MSEESETDKTSITIDKNTLFNLKITKAKLTNSEILIECEKGI